MKRVGGLWAELSSLPHILRAAETAARGKRKRPDVAAFLMNLENEAVRLRRELLDGSYEHGSYFQFTIRDPKPRRISAAAFRDRVVHHALTAVLEPVFEKRFSRASYACRKGYGTHAALEAASAGARNCVYALRCDVAKYFDSIDHVVLKGLLENAIKCRATLQLAAKIVESAEEPESPPRYFEDDDLFSPWERRRGLPLGNQTSQFFANVYLNPLDQFVERQLQPCVYARYADDFVLFGDDKRELHAMRVEIERFLAGLRLRIHPGKSRVYRSCDGISFLGWRLFRERRRLAAGNVKRFRARLREMQAGYRDGDLEIDQISERIRAWIAHAAHGNTYRLREALLGQFAFVRGPEPEAARGLLEQQCQEPAGGVPQQQPS
jgi:RNA-directed DNA polymerase